MRSRTARRRSRGISLVDTSEGTGNEFLRAHSLTIVLWVLSLTFLSTAFMFEPGRVFDLLLGIGIGTFTVALLNTLAGPLRERNKPEKP